MGSGLGTGADGMAAPARGSRPVRGTRGSFLLRRAGSAPLLPVSLLLAVLTSVLVTIALASFATRALPAAARQLLARSPASTIQVSGQLTAAQASADQPVIRAAVHSALGRVPFTLTSARWSDQLALPPTGRRNQTPLIQAAALGNVRAHAQLTAGHWPGLPQPGAPIGVVLPVTTAATLHLPVGTVLTLRDSLTGAPVQLKMTGLFRPRDPAAAYWRVSLLGTTGQLVQGTFITYGPMLVNPAVLGPGGLPVSAASWLVSVHTASIPPGRAGELARRLGATATTLTRAQRLGGLQVSTGLPQVLAGLASSLVVARSLLLIGSLQLLLLAIAAAALAARLLTSQRDEETALLSARGVARAQRVRASLAEVCLLAVIGAAAGVVAGCYLADLLISASGLPASGGAGDPVSMLRRGLAGASWWPAVAIMVLVIIVVMWPALRPATPGAARLRRGRPAALASVARAGLDVALIALGALAFWELHRYSAVPRLSGGGPGIDPVLAVAPALALAGLALLPLRALPAMARLADRLSGRGRRLTAALASWQVSRRPVRAGSPVLVVILAVAIGTLVLAQHQSWRQSQLDQAAFNTGADVRVDLAAPLPLGQAGTVTAPRGCAARCRWPRSTAASRSSPWTPGRQPAPCCSGRTCPRCPPRRCGSGSPRRTRARPGPPRSAPPAGRHRHAAATPRRPPRCAVSEPVGAGRLGHRVLGPRWAAACRWLRSPADRQPGRGPREAALPAAPARPVAQLPAAGLPGPAPALAAGRAADGQPG
jgi:hypothetical protein